MINDNKDLCPEFSTYSHNRREIDFITAEARRIVESARSEIDQIKSKTNEVLHQERQSLEERASMLEETRKQMEEDANELERRYREMEENAFEEARRKGFEKGIEEGRAEGFRDGSEKARAAFEREMAEEVARRVSEACEIATEPIHKLLDEMKGTRQALLRNWEENILQISAAIAFQTIMREPTLLREAPLDLLREALDLAMNCATLKIRMNPRDVANLGDSIKAILEETGSLAKSELVPDPKITIGGCLVETSLGIVDERLESRLERIVDELSE